MMMIKNKIKTLLFIIIIITLFITNIHAENNNKIIIIKNINIIPMNNEEVIKNKTVIIKNGIIKSINDNDLRVINNLDNSIIIDGKNKYLIPGLIDMHAHIFEKNNLILYLVNGVTTIRNMAEFPDPKKNFNSIQRKLDFKTALNLKNKINTEELVGPEILQASYVLDGYLPFAKRLCTAVKKSNLAEKFVKDAVEDGYDYIKIYWNLPKDTFYSVIDAARKYDIKVIGHVPFSVTLEEALISGMYSIEHLTGHYDDNVDENIKYFAKLAKDNNVYNCPTLVNLRYILPYEEWKEAIKKEENKYISSNIKKIWDKEMLEWNRRIKMNKKNNIRYAGHYMDYFYFLVNELYNAGAKILLGTDAGMPYLLPGFSIHEELELLVNSGLSPYQAIKAGTYDAAECLEKLDEIGTIEAGKDADFILLSDNPLENIKNTKKITDIFIDGKWFSRTELNKMLEMLKE